MENKFHIVGKTCRIDLKEVRPVFQLGQKRSFYITLEGIIEWVFPFGNMFYSGKNSLVLFNNHVE